MFDRLKGLSPHLALGAGALALSSLLAGCGGGAGDDDSVRVGVIAGPESELMEVAQRIAKERFDLDVQIVEFTDYVSPNAALADGSIDANAYQHAPYLQAMNQDRGYDLVSAGNTFLYPIGAYSRRHDSIEALPEGATIALPNDPSNQARALLMLDQAGLISLVDDQNPEATLDDISDNPHGLQFREVDAAQLPRSLDDVDLAFINNTFAQPAGLTPEDALLREGTDSPYVNLIVVRNGDQELPKIRHLVEAFQTEEVANRAEALFQCGAIPGWQ
ncbi:MetQ/NlpA family ABC transporter substrate-binding protein [Halotalea alkalilenta]|uniref:MetQ/NlpA family ABC transporter substrate-binding protein n=1 Tax=Halotalea alkalilenta TaxID=376489 RepID=UPI000480A67A|nr:MetQ/NlpA family ABC transporter substrate-binding protein [Halotalea alkalilenta]